LDCNALKFFITISPFIFGHGPKNVNKKLKILHIFS
jgi:hypothetical protein